ncbi:acrosin-like [Pantherophis guttatus]|uniref:Acrosin-like n=1 Tax=Pantherophis guttatus TaxID=94885 RepID=A0A6P9ATV9_PANGU|nr:acrosin-like [Pantherophis guttatus]
MAAAEEALSARPIEAGLHHHLHPRGSLRPEASKAAQHAAAGGKMALNSTTSSLHLWRIVVGATDLSKLPDDVQTHTVSKVVLHQDYNPLTEENDIALIKLDSPVTFNDYVQPACLPRVTMGSETNFTSCFATGWGITAENSVRTSDVLQEAKLNILDTQKCNSSDWYNGAMSPHTLCAGYEEGGIDTCQNSSFCFVEGTVVVWFAQNAQLRDFMDHYGSVL